VFHFHNLAGLYPTRLQLLLSYKQQWALSLFQPYTTKMILLHSKSDKDKHVRLNMDISRKCSFLFSVVKELITLYATAALRSIPSVPTVRAFALVCLNRNKWTRRLLTAAKAIWRPGKGQDDRETGICFPSTVQTYVFSTASDPNYDFHTESYFILPTLHNVALHSIYPLGNWKFLKTSSQSRWYYYLQVYIYGLSSRVQCRPVHCYCSTNS
jgi:hypothetical protein